MASLESASLQSFHRLGSREATLLGHGAVSHPAGPLDGCLAVSTTKAEAEGTAARGVDIRERCSTDANKHVSACLSR